MPISMKRWGGGLGGRKRTISGEKLRNISVYFSLVCGDYEQGFVYYGNDISSYNNATLTKEECSCSCLADDACKLWQFIGKMYGLDSV